MKIAYTSLAKYYDLIFQGKNYQRESDFIKNVVAKRRPNSKSILDVGCGTGNHLNLLKDDFGILYGVDLNPEIIKEAKKKSPKIKYLEGKMTNFNLKRKFDVLISLYSVFNYNLSVEDAISTLENFKRHLNPKGLVVIALYTPTPEKQISLNIGKKDDVEVVKINEFATNEETKIQDSNFLVLIKDKNGVNFFTEANHKYRIYKVNEFTKLLKETGFRKIEVIDNFTEKSVSRLTKFPVFIASLEC